ncbi:MAG TPA: hypothetical protein VMM12_05875 [Longimicrobiales bacterium]|nr:hypothetical protein [Longimicrobiales bacterium]
MAAIRATPTGLQFGYNLGAHDIRASDWKFQELNLTMRLASGIPKRDSARPMRDGFVYSEVAFKGVDRGDIDLSTSLTNRRQERLEIGVVVNSGSLRHSVQSDGEDSRVRHLCCDWSGTFLLPCYTAAQNNLAPGSTASQYLRRCVSDVGDQGLRHAPPPDPQADPRSARVRCTALSEVNATFEAYRASAVLMAKSTRLDPSRAGGTIFP